MVLGGFAIFGMFSEVLPTAITNPFIIVLFVFLFIVLPILGNLYPRYISFLLSMRYYAGTWAYSIWLFKDDAKLKVDEHVTKTSPSVEWQLSVLYDDHTYKSMLSRLIGFRMLHTPSRLINRLYIFLPMGLHLTQSVTPAVLIAYGQQHIAERAVQPKKIYFLDELPLTAVGKVFKPKLADLQTMEVCLEELEALDLFNELDLQVKLTTDRGRVTFIKATSKDGQNHSGAIRGALSDYTFAFEVL